MDAALALYGPDGCHPSPLGSYIAALAIYRGLTAPPPQVFESFRSPSGAFPAVNIQPATARTLEDISTR
jgi:hypothetical protein